MRLWIAQQAAQQQDGGDDPLLVLVVGIWAAVVLTLGVVAYCLIHRRK